MQRTSKYSELACSGCGHRWQKKGYSNREKSPGQFVKTHGQVQSCPQCGLSDYVQVLSSPERPRDKRYAKNTHSQPRVVVPGGLPEQQELMQPSERTYRALLQEALLWATQQVMTERSEEIKARAHERARTLLELRK